MATGFGVEPTKDGSGVITSGQTAEDTRRVWGALYTDGILNGCGVTTSSSSLQYTVAPGAVMIPYSSGQVVPAPFYGGTITVANAPASGERTDILYAKQNIPSADGSSNVVLQVGTSLPSSRAVELGRFVIQAGVTNTSSAFRSTEKRFAVPLSNGKGLVHKWVDAFSGVHNQNQLQLGHGTINLPTDRRVRMAVSSCLYASGASRFDDSKYCEWYFIMNVDGTDIIKFTTTGLHQAWGTYYFEYFLDVPAGQHTFSYKRGREVGPGSAATHYGLDNSGQARHGTVFTVEDHGPIV